MKKKINDILLKIFAIALVPAGLFGVIYEYVIWDDPSRRIGAVGDDLFSDGAR